MQAIAQNGLTFAQDPYDRERYEALRVLAAEVVAAGSTLDFSRALELFTAEAGYATPKVDVRGVVFRASVPCCLASVPGSGSTRFGNGSDERSNPR